ncbi:hypothetical protein [Roseovarius litorisediminis]|nr:hypothetical protein [Roseovarius litorisediminis]
MQDKHWHILEEDGVLTYARRVPVRFDLAVRTTLPSGSRRRIARQIRQDIWRVLRDLRGFSPVVQVTRVDAGLDVIAGGQVDGRFARAMAETRIGEVLECPRNRARWMRWAA